MVGTERVELSWVAPQRPQRCAYTSSATSPQILFLKHQPLYRRKQTTLLTINYWFAFADVFVFDTVLAAVFVFVREFVFTTTATFDGRLLTSVETFASTATFAFVSTLALASVTGVDSDGASPTVSSTEIFPVSAGIARSKADSIKTVAAAIVTFDKIVCEPRG